MPTEQDGLAQGQAGAGQNRSVVWAFYQQAAPVRARLAEISRDLVALDRLKISVGDVAAVLGGFQSFFDRLTKAEAAEAIALLVEQVIYHREKGTLAISFYPSGITSLIGSVTQ